MPRAKIPWPPEIPARMVNALTPFTAYDGGWCRWYHDKMVHICGKGTPLDQIDGSAMGFGWGPNSESELKYLRSGSQDSCP